MKKFILLTMLLIVSGVSVFAQTGGLKGKVRNSKRSGIAGATVTVRQDGKDLKSVTTDGKGGFEIRGLEAGNYNIVFEGQGYSSGLLSNVEVKKGQIRQLPDNLVLGVDQGTQVLIKGSVFNQDGRSVTGAEVRLEKINSDGSTSKIGTVYTNISGEFSFRQPESTSHFRVTAKLKDATANKEVETEGAGIYRLAITLELPK